MSAPTYLYRARHGGPPVSPVSPDVGVRPTTRRGSPSPCLPRRRRHFLGSRGQSSLRTGWTLWALVALVALAAFSDDIAAAFRVLGP
jgi:hypothetical protein